MKKERLRWWSVTGYEWTEVRGKARSTRFIKVVEATSRRKALLHHSRPVRFKDFDGSLIQAVFSNEHGSINLLPKKFTPGNFTHVYLSDVKGIVQISRAPRYQCDCGRVHVSDQPYDSVWCHCGGRAHRLAIEEQFMISGSENENGRQFADLLQVRLGDVADAQPIVQSS